MLAVPSMHERPVASTARKKVSVLGVTGSIGSQTTELLLAQPERFEVEAVASGRNAKALAEKAQQLQAKVAVIADDGQYKDLKALLSGSGIEAMAGEDALCEAATRPVDVLVAGITGFSGLRPTLEAIKQGTTVALANKECLVAAGPVFLQAVAAHQATVLPIDSEHSAIFQLFDDRLKAQVEKVILTASGGPFRDWSLEAMANVTAKEAVKHPNWSMGAKISVDSATLMNKGLEIIEASYLFDLEESKLGALIHPQSIVHSLVQYHDGSVLAQMGLPDMRTPISYALAWPQRMHVTGERLDLASLGQLAFEAVDSARFPCFSLALHALREGRGKPTILNAANEVAVAAFLDGRLEFLGIAKLVESVLHTMHSEAPNTLEEVVALDLEARKRANNLL